MIKSNSKLKSLDILKGIAMIMIIIVHTRHFTLKDMTGMRQLINYGQTGVELFFLISGIALNYSWNRFAAESNVSASFKQRYVSFILSRYLRLAPGFLIILIINLFLNIIFIDFLGISPGFIMNRNPLGIIANILFFHGLCPQYINSVFPSGWYIGTTFILYAFFPILVLIFEKLYTFNKHSIILIPVLAFACNLIITFLLSRINSDIFYPYNNSFMYFSFINQLPVFSLGILLYFQEKDNFTRKIPLWLVLILTILSNFIAVKAFLHSDLLPLAFCVIPFLCGIAFYWLTVTFIHIEKSPVFDKIKSAKKTQLISAICVFLADCGKNSYGMYLTHGLFCFYAIKALTTTLDNRQIAYNDLTLYMILIIPTILAVYAAGKLLNIFLNKIDRKLR